MTKSRTVKERHIFVEEFPTFDYVVICMAQVAMLNLFVDWTEKSKSDRIDLVRAWLEGNKQGKGKY